jgi:hypothetical protein
MNPNAKDEPNNNREHFVLLRVSLNFSQHLLLYYFIYLLATNYNNILKYLYLRLKNDLKVALNRL